MFLRFAILMIIWQPILAANWTELYKNQSQAIPIINQAGAICSGALIAEDTSITAAHCVNRLYNTYVKYGETELKAMVVHMDESSDIAILKHPAIKNLKPVKILSKKESLEPGARLATIGHPSPGKAFANPNYHEDFTYLMSQGILSRNTETNIISDMSVSPGNSGGAVFNDQEQLVGIVSRKRIDMGVGNIGISGNHKEIHNAIKASKSTKGPLSLWNAKSNFFTNISLSRVSQDNSNISFDPETIWTLDLGLSIFSRYQTFWKFNINKPDGLNEYTEWRNAFSFGFEMANHTYFFLSPTISAMKLNERGIMGYGIKFSHSIFPLSLSYMKYAKDDVLGELSSIEFHFGTTF